MQTATSQEANSYDDSLAAVRRAIEAFKGCTEQERQLLQRDVEQLQEMAAKLQSGQVEIVVFGEIST